MKNQGFVTIGSSEQNEIQIDSIYVNGSHLKIIYASSIEQPAGSTPSFMRKPKLVTRFFIRDISKSNRVQYVLENENKYFTLKKGITFIDDEAFAGGKGKELTADDVIYSIKRFADANVNLQSYVLLSGFVVGLDDFRKATKEAGKEQITRSLISRAQENRQIYSFG